MHKSPTIRIARRIFVRLARACNQQLPKQQIYAVADVIATWTREQREAWLLNQYEIVKHSAHIDEVSLARFVTGIDYHG